MLEADLLTMLPQHIAAQPAEQWQIAGVVDTWHEVLAPEGLGLESDARAHLAFLVMVTSSVPVLWDSDRTAQTGEYLARVQVIFQFALDPAAQMDSVRLAARAAAQLTRAIEAFADWADEGGIAAIDVTEAFAPRFFPDARFLEVGLGFDIRFDRGVR